MSRFNSFIQNPNEITVPKARSIEEGENIPKNETKEKDTNRVEQIKNFNKNKYKTKQSTNKPTKK